MLIALVPTTLAVTRLREALFPDLHLVPGVVVGNIIGVIVLTWVLMPLDHQVAGVVAATVIDDLPVAPGVVIPAAELVVALLALGWRRRPARQHVSDTRVELSWDLERLVRAHATPNVDRAHRRLGRQRSWTACSPSRRRSAARSCATARPPGERLAELVAAAIAPPPPRRRPTKPSTAAKAAPRRRQEAARRRQADAPAARAPSRRDAMRRRDGRVAAAGIGTMFFVNGATFASWSPRLPELQDALGISDAALGLTLLGSGVGGLIASSFSGWLVDHRGSRTMTVVTSAALSLCAAAARRSRRPQASPSSRSSCWARSTG